jgi:hypothetical protein
MGNGLMNYNTQRDNFNKVYKLYMDYLEIYRYFNHGTIRGCTNFRDFYWLHTYHIRSMSLTDKFNRN